MQHIEKTVSMPIHNPDTGGVSRTFNYMGKIDRIEGRKVVDWKTASDPHQFIKEKKISFQCECYALAAHAAGIELDEMEYRIIRVPSIRFAAEDRKVAAATGLTVAQCYEDRAYLWILNQLDGVVEHTIQITQSRLETAKAWLWENTKRILDNRRASRWLPNCLACHTWSRECEYMPLCEAVASGLDIDWLASEYYQECEAVHPELNGAGKEKDVVTFSSLSCLSLCEQKYCWRYEMGLRPKRDDSEAIRIGSCSHAALEAYASGGIDAARSAVTSWMELNPALGEDAADKATMQAAKAMAVCRAAAKRWSI